MCDDTLATIAKNLAAKRDVVAGLADLCKELAERVWKLESDQKAAIGGVSETKPAGGVPKARPPLSPRVVRTKRNMAV